MTDDTYILSGLNEIINESQAKEGYEEIEQRMIKSGVISKPRDPTNEFKKDIKDAFKKLNIDFPDVDLGEDSSSVGNRDSHQKEVSHTYGGSGMVSGDRFGDRLAVPNSAISGLSSSFKPYEPPSGFYGEANDEKRHSSLSDEENKHSDEYKPPPPTNPAYNQTEPSYSQSGLYNSTLDDNSSYPTRNELGRDPDDIRSRTEEQEYQSHISSAIKDSSHNRTIFSVEEERREDLKTNMIAEIDFYRDTLEDDDYDLSKVPKVTIDSTFEEVENIHKMLRLKNDRNRYCTFAEEFILLGAYLLEDVFDGKRVWFGRRPDMSGWNNHVRSKLHRMRYDTSKVVSDVMSDHNVSSGWRIMMELVPNAIMYSKEKKNKRNEPSLYTDDDMNTHMNNIRDIDERE